MTETYPDSEDDVFGGIKPRARHCYIEYYKGDVFEEPLKFFLIEDEETISKVIRLGYSEKEMQSLMASAHYEYLTTDTLKCNGEIKNKYIAGEELAKSLIEENGFLIPEEYSAICFSFPKHMIDKSGKIIKKV